MTKHEKTLETLSVLAKANMSYIIIAGVVVFAIAKHLAS